MIRRSAARGTPEELQVFQSFASVLYWNMIKLDADIFKYTFALLFQFTSLLDDVNIVLTCLCFWRATNDEFD